MADERKHGYKGWRFPEKDFVTGLIVTADCKLVAKVSLSGVHPKGTSIPGLVRAAVASYYLARTGGDLHLCIQGISVCLSPGNGFLALVVSGNDSQRFDTAFKARQISNLFNLLHGNGLESDLGDYRKAGSLEKEWNQQSGHPFDMHMLILLRRNSFRDLWLREMKKVPGLIVGGLIDFSLNDRLLFEVCGAKELVYDQQQLEKILSAVKKQCRVLSAERANRRHSRRRLRKEPAATVRISEHKKLCSSYMRFCLLEPIVCACIKVVRLPEHDPCLVLICEETECQSLGDLHSMEQMLQGDPSDLESLVVNNNEESFPPCARMALQVAKTNIKSSFPKSMRNGSHYRETVTTEIEGITIQDNNTVVIESNCKPITSDLLAETKGSSVTGGDGGSPRIIGSSHGINYSAGMSKQLYDVGIENGREDSMVGELTPDVIDSLLDDIAQIH